MIKSALLTTSAIYAQDQRQSFSVETTDWREVIELLDGFMIGALQTEEVYDMNQCIKDFNPLVTDLSEAIADFKDGSYYRITDGLY